MTEKKIRVINPNRFDVGIRLFDTREMNIRAGSFVMLTETDIEYLASICSLFSEGVLRIEAAEEDEILENLGISKEDNTNFMSDDEIKKKLGQSVQKLKLWLADIDDEVALHRIGEIAKAMDLPSSKMKVVVEKIPDAEE